MGISSHPSFKDVLDDGPPTVLKAAWIIGVILTAINFVTFSVLTHLHLKRSKLISVGSSSGEVGKKVQKLCSKTIQILAMVPVFSLTSYIGLVFMRAGPFFELAQVCYEAWVIWVFYRYIKNLLGGEEKATELLGETILSACGGCCGVPTRMKMIKYGILQIVIVHPLLAFLIVLLTGLDHYNVGEWTADQGFPYINITFIISSVVGVASLLHFFLRTRSFLSEYSIGIKFLGMKFIVLCNVLQNLILSFLVKRGVISTSGIYSDATKVDAIRNGLIVIEITFVGFLMCYAFRPSDLGKENHVELASISKSPK